MSNCINCSHEITGNYCSNCAQPVLKKRLTWSVFLDEFNQRFLGVDSKFSNTVVGLTLNPGKVVKSYIEGNRVKYLGPVGYMFILLTIFLLLASILNVNLSELSQDMNSAMVSPEDNSDSVQVFHEKVMEYYRVLTFIMVPFFLLGTYLVFRKKGYNFVETGVFVFFVQGHLMFFNIIQLFAFKFFHWTSSMLMMALSVIYVALAASTFYDGNKIANAVKGILTYIIGFIFFFIAIIIGVVIVMALFPSILEGYVNIPTA